MGQRSREPAEPHPKAASLRSPSGHWRTASRTQTPILRSLGWLNIEDVISERDCIRAFLALNDPDTPSALRRLFIQTCLFRQGTASRDTRLARPYQLHLPRVRLAATQRTSSYCAANSWNSLLETVLHELNRAVQKQTEEDGQGCA